MLRPGVFGRSPTLNPPVLAAPNLPWSDDLVFKVSGRQNPDHPACRPVHKPFLALGDDIVGLARTPEQKDSVAELGIDHVVRACPLVSRPPLARLGMDGLVGV